LLGDGQLAAGLEECRQLVALTGFGFKQREYAERHGHGNGVLPSRASLAGRSARFHVVGVVSRPVSYL
jgi:hypothetical protein